MTALFILNLSSPAKRLQTGELSLGGINTTIYSPESIPGYPSLVLYIVGNAVPNSFVKNQGEAPITERELADAIKEQRGNNPTLIIWDMCFAESFLTIPGVSFGENYTHIFSCRAFERTWHTGGTERVTLFSKQLQAAFDGLKTNPRWTWGNLETALRERYGRIQQPLIQGGPEPDVFFGPSVYSRRLSAA